MNRTLLLALAVLALDACKRTPPPPPKVTLDDMPKADHSRELALRDPGGTRPVDVAVRALQEKVRKLDKPEVWTALGELWVRKARESADPVYYVSADAAAQVALAAQPDFSPARSLRGLVLVNQHRFAEARDLATETLAKHPDDLLAYGVLSDSNLELGQYALATQAAQHMVDLKPNLASYARAAHLMFLHGDLAGAKEAYRLAIDAGADARDLEPRAWVIVQTALLFFSQGDLPGAQAGFDEALRELPHYPPALVGLGKLALARGDGKAAVAALAEAVAASPLLETRWLLGDAKKLAGDAAGAEAVYAQVQKEGAAIDPRTLALFLATHDRDPARAVILANAERKVRDDVWTEDARAWALFRAGQLAEARTASDAAIALGTPEARLWYHAGAIRLAQGDASGRAMVERALKLNPGFDLTGAAEARALLARK